MHIIEVNIILGNKYIYVFSVVPEMYFLIAIMAKNIWKMHAGNMKALYLCKRELKLFCSSNVKHLIHSWIQYLLIQYFLCCGTTLWYGGTMTRKCDMILAPVALQLNGKILSSKYTLTISYEIYYSNFTQIYRAEIV